MSKSANNQILSIPLNRQFLGHKLLRRVGMAFESGKVIFYGLRWVWLTFFIFAVFFVRQFETGFRASV
jgi:hypothetical protein